MQRRQFLLAALAASAPVKVNANSNKAKLTFLFFRVPHFYVAADRELDQEEWTLYISFYARPTDSLQTDFPRLMQKKFADCIVPGRVTESQKKSLEMRTSMEIEEIIKAVEELVV